jgi:hypothetical protein
MNGKLLAEFAFFTERKLQEYCVVRKGSVFPIHTDIQLVLMSTTAYHTEMSPWEMKESLSWSRYSSLLWKLITVSMWTHHTALSGSSLVESTAPHPTFLSSNSVLSTHISVRSLRDFCSSGFAPKLMYAFLFFHKIDTYVRLLSVLLDLTVLI